MLGNRTRAKVVKNKVAPPFKQAEFDIMYGKGISREGDIMDSAIRENIIEKSGSWYSFDGDRIGQGRENVKNYLKENPEIMAKVEKLLMDSFDPKPESEDGIKVDEDGVIIDG